MDINTAWQIPPSSPSSPFFFPLPHLWKIRLSNIMLNLPAKKYYLYNKCATVIRTFQEDLKDSENLRTNTIFCAFQTDVTSWTLLQAIISGIFPSHWKVFIFMQTFFSSNTIDQTKSHISGHDQNSETLHTKTLSNP